MVLTLLWGINWPVMKVALSEIPVLTFRASCIFLAGLIVLGLHRALGRSIRVPRHQWKPFLISGLFNITCWHLLTGFGLVNTTSGRAAIIAYTMPVWAIPIAYVVLGDRPGWRRLLALALGIGGILVLVTADLRAIGAAPLGPLLMLAGAIAWACGAVAQKRVRWDASSWVLFGWQCLICGTPIFVAAGVFDGATLSVPSLWPLLALTYSVLAPFVICYYAYYEIVRIFPVGVATVGMLGVPIVALFSGAYMLGETLGVAEYAALGLVVGALALLVINRADWLRAPA